MFMKPWQLPLVLGNNQKRESSRRKIREVSKVSSHTPQSPRRGCRLAHLTQLVGILSSIRDQRTNKLVYKGTVVKQGSADILVDI